MRLRESQCNLVRNLYKSRGKSPEKRLQKIRISSPTKSLLSSLLFVDVNPMQNADHRSPVIRASMPFHTDQLKSRTSHDRAAEKSKKAISLCYIGACYGVSPIVVENFF